MNTHDAIEKVKHLKDYIMVFENIHQVTLMDDSDKEAIDTVVEELDKPTPTLEQSDDKRLLFSAYLQGKRDQIYMATKMGGTKANREIQDD